jgi:hypothetical protein
LITDLEHGKRETLNHGLECLRLFWGPDSGDIILISSKGPPEKNVSCFFCPTCKDPLIARVGFLVTANRLTSDGTCPSCHTSIPGIWS